jgi:hypothetical protein
MYVHALENPATLAARWLETAVEYINNVNVCIELSLRAMLQRFFSVKECGQEGQLSLPWTPYLSILFPPSFSPIRKVGSVGC